MSYETISTIGTPATDDDRQRWLGLTRGELMTLLFTLASANALVSTAFTSIAADGLFYAVMNTFKISVIVWAGLALGINFGLKGGGEIRLSDKIVAGLVAVVCFMPLGPMTWIAITGLALYGIFTSYRTSEPIYRASWLFLAMAVPMFWSKRLFSFFAEYFLAGDAILISSITRTERISNLVAIPNGSGYLQIAPPCSSLANVSLAILAWVVFTQATGLKWHPRNILWCAFACVSVIAINVTRISMIGFFPEKYELIHGPTGSTVASWVTLIVVVVICNYGVKHGQKAV